MPFIAAMPLQKSQSTTPSRPFTILRVRRRIGAPHWGKLIAGNRMIPCAIGRTGISAAKREGDGASPLGVFPLIALYFRPDRPRPRSGLPLIRIRPDDGWCDAPGHPRYNRRVKRPFAASHEEMWREDRLYDLVVDIAWNRGPVVQGRGSAIFMHAARPGFTATAGCVALKPRDLRWLAARLGPRTRISIE